MRPSVLLVLDLREYADPPSDEEGSRRLWAEVEPELIGRDLRPDQTITVRRPGGVIGATVLESDLGAGWTGPDTTFAVCGVLERPKLLYRCGPCADAGQVRYGPFLCSGCGSTDTRRRVCDDHVVILDLSFAKATCPAHVPACECGRTASFWCTGPGCGSGKAWCDQHRRRHPGDELISYCRGCYDRRFPDCSTGGCRSIGTLSCEFQAGAGSCRTRVCPGHAFRWQVYGPARRGLVLCPAHHQRLPSLAADELVRQVISGTLGRRRGRSRVPKLPRLSLFQHIFINVQKRLLTVPQLYDLADQVYRADRSLTALIDEHRPGWQRERTDAITAERDGQHHFARLGQELTAMGHGDMVARISFSIFKPHAGELWVRVPQDLKGRFIGTRGATINALRQRIGLQINLEKL
ncbi:KH domain-containing protein [Actinoplanes sp. NPDC049548]|uniref:KH domain-containing protein n=1 Tax=Actinoplanes sp. NPDC049548 TaxID=3155152 RepID=UPI0034268539